MRVASRESWFAVDVMAWLLDSDPAIRWQVMRDFTEASPNEVAEERARIVTEGWGARLLAARGADGLWASGACFPGKDYAWDREAKGQPWISTFPVLQLLVDFGVDPESERMREVIDRVRASCRWEHAGQAFFDGEVEPCINGRLVKIGVYFGIAMDAVVERLLGEQLADGGWNCEVENGSVRSSFATTINVLEGLIAYEKAVGEHEASAVARRKGEEYLLERRLFRRKSTGAVVKQSWLEFSFPTRWQYDVLRALEYFASAGGEPDLRLQEATDLVRRKRQTDGRWLLENTYAGLTWFEMEDGDGKPSRWNTLRALRVLR